MIPIEYQIKMKTIPGFPKYKVTKDGRIWSLHRNRFLKNMSTHNTGYTYVDLYQNNKHHHRHIHRLVLETYVGPCPAGMEGCHYDGDRTNNTLSNLRWDTQRNNRLDAVRLGVGVGETHGRSKLTWGQVTQIRNMLKNGDRQIDIANTFDVCRQTISYIKLNKIWKCKESA